MTPLALTQKSPAVNLLNSLRQRVDFGHALLLFYFIAVVRQWFWPIDNRFAWWLTIPIALAGWIFYLSYFEPRRTGRSLSFWLIVGLPLLFAYLLRAPFPDTSFDVWGLRLFHGERSLRGFLYLPGELFPTAAPFNPTPDMVTAIFRHLLGYRLGTVVNLLVLLWTATVVDKLIQPYVRRTVPRALCVLPTIFVEHLLFEINNYMPDLLALPLLLEATYLTLENPPGLFQRKRVVQVALLLGLAIGLKLSNGAVALPIAGVWVWRALKARPLNIKELSITTFISLIVFFAPFFSFMIWVYRLTGSPIFPLYNKIFRSPLYPPFIGWDDRWGGNGLFEILAWPVLMVFEPVRTAELPVYSGRLSAAFVVTLLSLFFIRRYTLQQRLLIFIFLFGTLLWSLTMGYIRYGLYLEVLSGLILICLSASLLANSSRRLGDWRLLLAGLVMTTAVLQSIIATRYLLRTEWSLRPTLFDDFSGYKRETRNFIFDRSITQFQNASDRAMFDRVDVWIVSGAKTSGLMLYLNERAKFVGVRWGGLYLSQATRDALKMTLDRLQGKQMWSLSLGPDFSEALFALRNTGLSVGEIREVTIPFFSNDDPVNVYLFSVTRNPKERPEPKRTVSSTPLAPEKFSNRITAVDLPSYLRPSDLVTLFFRLENLSDTKWPSLAQSDGNYQIVLRSRFFLHGRQIGKAAEASLPYDYLPGDQTTLPLQVIPPPNPGSYDLILDVFQRGANDRSEAAPSSTTIPIRVQPGAP